MVLHPIRFAALALLATLVLTGSAAPARAAFGFVEGNYYTTDYFGSTITEETPAGAVVGTFTIPTALGTDSRGLTFGPDGLLYLTEAVGSGFNVLAFSGAGVLQKTYTMPNVYAGGNLSYGKLAVNTQYIYVAAGNQVTRFNLGNPTSGTVIYTDNQLFDVNLLPNGHILTASAYSIQELTITGTLVRTLNTGSFTLGNVRGIQYNPATGKLFVTMLGYTGESDQLMRFDATTGVLEKQTTFNYGDDLFLTTAGTLLVGSRTQVPRIYTQDLVQTGTVDTISQMFITQDTVPEPASAALLVSGAALLLIRRPPARRPSA